MTCVLLCRGDWGSGLGDGYGGKGRAGLSRLTFQGCGSREWSLYDRLCPKLAAANASGLRSLLTGKNCLACELHVGTARWTCWRHQHSRGWKIKLDARLELSTFRSAVTSATTHHQLLPFQPKTAATCGVRTTVASQTDDLLPCYGISESPSGCLPSCLTSPEGSLVAGIPAEPRDSIWLHSRLVVWRYRRMKVVDIHLTYGQTVVWDTQTRTMLHSDSNMYCFITRQYKIHESR